MGCFSSNNGSLHLKYLNRQRDKPDTTKNTLWCNYKEFSYATTQMCGWRPQMEDALIAKCPTHLGSQVSLFGIFDGHGGSQISKYLSQNLQKWLLNCPFFKKGCYQESLKENFLRIDDYLRSEKGQQEMMKIQERETEGRKSSRIMYSGSTAVIVLITPQKIHIAHTGDSKAVLIKDNQVIYETIDHKPHFPLELERINSNGGFVEKQRLFGDLSVSRGFGDFHYKDNENPQKQFVSPIPQVSSFDREDINLIMMGCDGIWQSKETTKIIENIVEKVQKSKSQSMGERLGWALQMYMNENISQNPKDYIGTDNMSGILIKFNAK